MLFVLTSGAKALHILGPLTWAWKAHSSTAVRAFPSFSAASEVVT
jgi:hypothetical protein